MQWSETVRPPSQRTLRQFAALCLVASVGFAAWLAVGGQVGMGVWGVGLAGTAVGVAGLVRPGTIRWIYTGWMVVTFPIGWTVSWLLLLVLFYVVFTPMGVVFRLMGRDALRLRPPSSADASLWVPKHIGDRPADYFRPF